METDYATVVDPGSLMSTGIPMLIHLFFVALEIAVALHFLVHGVMLLRAGDPTPSWGRLGMLTPTGTWSAHRLGGTHVVLGVAILLPLGFGAPTALSAVALVAGVVVLWRLGGSASAAGRTARRAVIAASGLVFGFLLFEGEDPARQMRELVTKAVRSRDHELGWQLAHDVDSPKVGDLAPDFELQDPAGEKAVRLSSFRGKRPVALVFGSYT